MSENLKPKKLTVSFCNQFANKIRTQISTVNETLNLKKLKISNAVNILKCKKNNEIHSGIC